MLTRHEHKSALKTISYTILRIFKLNFSKQEGRHGRHGSGDTTIGVGGHFVSETSYLAVYYENGIPSIFESALEDGNGEAVREWLEEQRTSDTIEEVTEEMLQHLESPFRCTLFRFVDSD